jgi:hypothetical protein
MSAAMALVRELAQVYTVDTDQAQLIALVQRAQALVKEPGEVSEWQPIETAPKDGTHVVLLVPGCRSVAVVGHWFDFGQVVHGVTGFWEASATQIAPTHWMPLPEPPK